MTRRIPLTQGKFALVDDDLFDYLNQWKWQANNEGGNWYATRTEGKRPNRKRIAMHRVVVNARPGFDVDHRDHDGLNNQRANLRECTRAENVHNRRKKRGVTTSQYKGVHKIKNSWKAQLAVGGIYVLAQYCSTPEEAARAYDKAAREHFGEFAVLNFPD